MARTISQEAMESRKRVAALVSAFTNAMADCHDRCNQEITIPEVLKALNQMQQRWLFLLDRED